jgi:NADH dehydrogenase/NADH:ubiquinone oxidoreductase subunit G
LKKAIERGARVITLNSTEHVPGRFASLWLQPQPGKEEEMVDMLIAGHEEGAVGQAVDLLRKAEKAVLLVGPDTLVRMPEAIERLHAVSGGALVAIPAEGNLSGALRLGLGAASHGAAPRVLYLIGTPVSQGQELDPDIFVLYQNTHMPAVELQNGYLLPMAGFGEMEGSLFDQAGRIKPLSQVVPAAGDALPGWEILCRIARAMGQPGFDFASAAEIAREMAETPVNWTRTVNPPLWLAAPGEHDFLGANLSDWVSGLQMLPLARPQEGKE